MASPAFAPPVMPCEVESGTTVDFAFEDSVADAATKEDEDDDAAADAAADDDEDGVGVDWSERTKVELRREFEDDSVDLGTAWDWIDVLWDWSTWAGIALEAGSALVTNLCAVEATGTSDADGVCTVLPRTGPKVVKPPIGPSKVGVAVT